MQYFSFQPDLTKAYPILKDTQLILSDEVDANMVQDIILQNLLPGAFSILGTKVRLSIVTVMIYNDTAYWDLIFEYPEYDKALPLLEKITDNADDIDDAFDIRVTHNAKSLYKLSFKVG